jgi:hypothetical protein
VVELLKNFLKFKFNGHHTNKKTLKLDWSPFLRVNACPWQLS